MNNFVQFWSTAVDLIWGLPLVIFILSTSVYFAYISRLQPLMGFPHALQILFGRFDEKEEPGKLSHFRALSVALSGTIGMGSIAGVAVAISLGGAGAVFWMWVAAAFGMIIKFFTCTLSCLYRLPDEDGIEQGGPMYFIERGLGPRFKPLAIMFAMAGLVGCLPMFQINQLANLVKNELSVEPLTTGLVSLFVIGIILIGDIKRVGKVTAYIVPLMFIIYLVSSITVIMVNHEMIPAIFRDILTSAFGITAISGGATGLIFKEVLITGIKRAVFSNEAGVGTEAMAHGAAQTKYPVREGLVAMLGPFIDTHIVCTCTAFVILSAGIETGNSGVVLTAMAFNQALPGVGNMIVYSVFILFALSTMTTYSYYNLKCARYLFGKRNGNRYVWIYLAIIPMGAIWTQATVVNIIDTMFALMILPTLISTLLLSKKVVYEMQNYFKSLKNRQGNHFAN